VRWSVAVEAEGDRLLTREEIVDLADAVAPAAGIASGIGTTRYGAQLVIDADDLDSAVGRARAAFTAAASRAGLPAWPIVRSEAVSEAEELADLDGLE
jgi:hypothetical protein